MSKRVANENGDGPLKGGDRPEAMDVDDREMGDFEDEFEDEFESEDEIFEAGVDGRPDAEREAEEKAGTFIVGRNKLEPGQTLAPDLSTYEMLHNLSTPWPCLSFDIVRDALGDNRKAYPATINEPGRPPTTLTATMTESGNVFIHDVTPHLASFDNPGTTITAQQNKPISTIRAHKSEGYAVDWSPMVPSGKLLTGDNDGLIYVTTRTDGGGWVTDNRPFQGHTSSVEEIQWSPSEQSVFASASSDGSIRIWDVRSKSRKPALTVQVSKYDVNVMSWSRQTSHLLASGADDGTWGVWDLRQWKTSTDKPQPLASFDFHKEQITSLEWHPTDDSIMAVAAGDSTVTLWDLAVELDDEESKDTAGVKDVPPQLLFVHYLKDAKEVHWHPQITGSLVATGEEFSVFRTISV
ncbi:Ribosome assembly protein RRB1 [Metarhizium anisopliae]|nr:Ribosome assembly protein RRB1 [Metarhizium anisopliae]